MVLPIWATSGKSANKKMKDLGDRYGVLTHYLRYKDVEDLDGLLPRVRQMDVDVHGSLRSPRFAVVCTTRPIKALIFAERAARRGLYATTPPFFRDISGREVAQAFSRAEHHALLQRQMADHHIL